MSPPPVIMEHPSDVKVRRGHSAYLTCKAEQGVLYDWYKDGKPYSKGSSSGQLVLSAVTLAHVGLYHCVVVNDGGSETSNKARVILGMKCISLLGYPT